MRRHSKSSMSTKAAFVLSLMASQLDAVALGHQAPRARRSKGYQLGDSLAGYGYSVDSQKIVDQQCFNATAGLPEGTSSVVSLSEFTSYSDFESKFSYSVKAGVSFGIFSAKADASYMKQVSDKDYTLSLNYFTYSYGTVRVQTGIGLDALTETGKQEYTNNLTNPYFDVVCGAEVVTSYQQGALLAMALKIEFESHMDKEQFEASASGSLGSIFSASSTVQSITSHYKMNGEVSLVAYQQGGDPGQLAKILSKDSGGSYYVTSCSLTNMAACQNTASGLLSYASSDFPNQFSVASGENLTTLGFGFYDKRPIEYIGLVPPKSLLNQSTLQAREDVASAYAQQLCYQDKFYSLFNGYPVSWQTSSPFYQQMSAANQGVKENVDIILGGAQPSGEGLEDCYLTPDRCGGILQAIQAGIKQVDFTFIQLLQYYYKGLLAVFYQDGTSWGYTNLANVEEVLSTNFTGPSDIYYAVHDGQDCNCLVIGPEDTTYTGGAFCDGQLQSDGLTISGTWMCTGAPECRVQPASIYRCKSPFFFDELARCDGSSRVSPEEADVCSPYPL